MEFQGVPRKLCKVSEKGYLQHEKVTDYLWKSQILKIPKIRESNFRF